MRLPRLTTRRLMVLVAVAAILAAGAVEGERRRARFHELAVYYSWRLLRSSTARHGAYFAMMRQKYLRAARYPWLPVPPDPPPPE